MSPGDLLIDGYNVLHAAGLARRSYGPGEFEKRRRDLIRLISQQLSPRERRRTTVVFDASDRTVMPSPPQVMDDVLVMFADEGGDADATIERLIQQNSAPRRMCVVSSDHRLQKAARRRRAKFVDSEVFLQRLARRSTPDERRRQQVEPAAKHSGQLPSGEVDAWLRVFDDIDQSELLITQRTHRIGQSDSHSQIRKPSQSSSKDAPSRSSSNSRDESECVSGEVEFWESRISELWENDSSVHD